MQKLLLLSEGNAQLLLDMNQQVVLYDGSTIMNYLAIGGRSLFNFELRMGPVSRLDRLKC